MRLFVRQHQGLYTSHRRALDFATSYAVPARINVPITPSHSFATQPYQALWTCRTASLGRLPFGSRINHIHATASTHKSAKMTPAAAASEPVIELSSMEDALCEMLVDACDWIEQYRPQPDPIESAGASVTYTDDWTCEARIAGGWVRDKLLGFASHDLDISLSSLTGHVFALLLRQYLLSPQFARSLVATRVGSPLRMQTSAIMSDSSSAVQLVSHITKIAANPEQSKNLETATATVAGLSLDFVNLRKEVYVGASRIPTMTFGTALEDAERRYITINALFYNIRTRRIEDLTEKGLADLRKQHIRTPLEPRQTFLDDPLRVLRCVRFASRLGYTVDDEIFRCLNGEDGQAIRHALTTKVSRERFGQEVDKMMLGPDPSRAIRLIEQMGMFDVIFGPPPGETIHALHSEEEPSENGKGESTLSSLLARRAVALLDVLRADAELVQKNAQDKADTGLAAALPFLFDAEGQCIVLDQQKQRLLYYSAALLPLHQVLWEQKPGKWDWAGACVLSNGMKISINAGRRPMTCMWRSATLLHRPTDACFDASKEDEYRGSYIPLLGPEPISPRSLRALLLRHPDAHWPDLHVTPDVRLVWAMVADLSADESLWPSSSGVGETADAANTSLESIARTLLHSPPVSLYVRLYDQLKAEGAWDRVDERTLLNGKETLSALKIKPSSVVALILKRVEAWQFDRDINHDNIEAMKQECREWLQRQWKDGQIVPFDER